MIVALALFIHPIDRTEIGSFRFSARDPWRPLYLGVLAALWFASRRWRVPARVGRAARAVPGAIAAPDAATTAAATAPLAAGVPHWRRLVPWMLAAAGLGAALIQWAPWQARPVVALKKLRVNIGADASLVTTPGAAAIVSPDATTLAFVARSDGRSRLFIRRLDELEATALAGTEGAESPFFSPNGQWVAFFADGQLKKVNLAGGPPVTLCEAPAGLGGSWGPGDLIAFAAATGSGLSRVSSAGGRPERLTMLDVARGEFSHRAHRAVDCSGCHSAARSSENTADVLIPAMKDCLKCHGSSGTHLDRCSECHLYHNKTEERRKDGRPADLLIGRLGPIFNAAWENTAGVSVRQGRGPQGGVH